MGRAWGEVGVNGFTPHQWRFNSLSWAHEFPVFDTSSYRIYFCIVPIVPDRNNMSQERAKLLLPPWNPRLLVSDQLKKAATTWKCPLCSKDVTFTECKKIRLSAILNHGRGGSRKGWWWLPGSWTWGHWRTAWTNVRKMYLQIEFYLVLHKLYVPIFTKNTSCKIIAFFLNRFPEKQIKFFSKEKNCHELVFWITSKAGLILLRSNETICV